ncbi:GroES-like protein [Xylogone sp. PMI_703]|nr:GroES-like protein [Xylogone sp. PMI_703]
MDNPRSIKPLPHTMRALVQQEYGKDLVVENKPVPRATSGSAVVKVLAGAVVPYLGEIYDGSRQYPYPTPLTTGCYAIARIAELGPDATSLHEGDLVWVDCVIRPRDNPSLLFLTSFHHGFSPNAEKLMQGEWRDGTFAEYAKMPLENLFLLDEAKVLGSLGYTPTDLVSMARMLVPYGGIHDIGITPGETVLIAPATGGWGGAAVELALILGAGRVIAMGRNHVRLSELAQLSPRVITLPMIGSLQEEVQALTNLGGNVDVFFDIGPPGASQSTYFQAGILALKHGGRACLMGGQMENVEIPYQKVMSHDLMIKGKLMYAAQDVREVLQMVETGIIKLGPSPGQFGLEQWKEAFTTARENSAPTWVALVP